MKLKVLLSVLILTIICFFCSCKENGNINTLPIVKNTEKVTDSNLSKSKNIYNLEKGSDLNAWTDNGSFWLLTFKPNKVIYEFNPSCSFWFPSKIVDNELVFYWELNENCNFNRGLRQKFVGIQNPEVGHPFGSVRMINDSTLTVRYFYEQWVDKINKQEKQSIDTLFPRSFKKIQL